MSPFELAALGQAKKALQRADMVDGKAGNALDTAAKAQVAAASALSASEEARTALNKSASQMEAVAAAAAAADKTAQSANASAQQASEMARQAASIVPQLFTKLAKARLPAGITAVTTNGHTVEGTGAATYVSDSKATAALAAAHPLACFGGEGGRYFRLIPGASGAITPEQLGCPATGNAQSFIQAAINYAHAVGIPRLELPAQRYELWAPIRNHGEDVSYGLSGHYILIRENIALVGTGRGGTLLRLLNSRGGTNDTITQPAMTYTPALDANDLYTKQQRDWIGTGINVRPNSGIDLIKLENIELDGTRTYRAKLSRSERDQIINLTHKGFRVQDVDVHRIEMRNVTLRNFGAEIMYTAGGMGIKEEYFENCVFDGSPQCTINSGTSARSTYVNCRAGRSYQIEIMGGYGKTFLDCVFYDLEGVALLGGAGAAENGYIHGFPYSYPHRRVGEAPPYMTFSGTVFERCGNVGIYSFARGDIQTVDSTISLVNSGGKLTDIDLRLTSIIDEGRGLTEALSINGPNNLITPIGTSGIMMPPSSNIRVDVTCERTEAARAANRSFQCAVRIHAMLFDANSVTVTVNGTGARTPAYLSGTPVPGFVWPRIVVMPNFSSPDAGSGIGVYNYLSADRTITLWVGGNAVEPQADGVFTVNVDNAGLNFVDGQTATIYHTSDNGRVVRFPSVGSGMKLQQDRYLINRGDRISLRWDRQQAAWIETGYSTSATLTMTGRTTYDAPAISAGGSANVIVTVPGAALGDIVSAVSFGNLDLRGLIVRGEVTGENKATVWLTNPTAVAVDLPKADLRLVVTKSFAV